MKVEEFFKEWISTKPNLKSEFHDAGIEAMAFADAYHKKQLLINGVVQAKPEEVFRWALFAQKLPDISRNIDLMHIDGSIRRNFKMTQKELDDLNKWTPRKWRYAT